MRNNLKYYYSSIVVTILGLIAGGIVGYVYEGSLKGALTSAFLTIVLSVLEVSLSFDNAVVNASVLRNMTPKWRHRFITWGMLIAVFGMRIVFPIVIVSFVAWISPWAAVIMATTNPDKYAETMLASHITLAGFGGSFLLMVCLGYFFDQEKETHWLDWFERPMSTLGKITAIEACIGLLLCYGLSVYLTDINERLAFLTSSIFGMVTFIAVDGVSSFLEVDEHHKRDIEKASAAMFVYLEILDASFSFDGVIGAFALTHNIFIIAIGLGIGAMFVRSMTLMLVDNGTLNEYRYLEHGAFYAIGALAVMMLLDVFVHVPEVVTGLLGAFIIIISLISSVRWRRRMARAH